MMNRRAALKLGAGMGLLAGTGFLGAYRLLPPAPSRNPEPVDALARRLYVSLDDVQRAETCVEYDHPFRQYHNRGVWGGGRSILFGFNREQRGILTDLFYAGVSSQGRSHIPDEDLTRWAGVHSMRVLICGDPTAPPYQIILTGVHLNLRLGGKNREGVAFGGPQVYGDQGGNNRVGLPGNVYRDQFLIAQRLFRSLDEGRRKHALLEEAPVQTQIDLQGRHGSFPGLPVRELPADSKALASELIERIFANYAAGDVAYARECIAANGGMDALSLSFYQHHEDGDIPEAQVFRLEGPTAVFYFRGHPHVHAFVNVAMDPDTFFSVGEPLATNPKWLDRSGVKALFEKALLVETGADVAHYSEDSVAGRLHPGVIRTGDIYSLESWQEPAELVEVRGSELSASLVAALRNRGVEPESRKTYKVATTSYLVNDRSREIGKIRVRQTRELVRDLTIKYLRKFATT